jgi:hypothetical protein
MSTLIQRLARLMACSKPLFVRCEAFWGITRALIFQRKQAKRIIQHSKHRVLSAEGAFTIDGIGDSISGRDREGGHKSVFGINLGCNSNRRIKTCTGQFTNPLCSSIRGVGVLVFSLALALACSVSGAEILLALFQSSLPLCPSTPLPLSANLCDPSQHHGEQPEDWGG